MGKGDPIKKKPTVERRGGVKRRRSRSEADEAAEKVGKTLVKRLRSKSLAEAEVELGVFEAEVGPRLNVFDRFFGKGGGLKTDKQRNSAFRRSWKGTDENFSTALTRNLIDGIIDGGSRSDFSDAEWERLVSMVDEISLARMDTGFTGFSTKDQVFQHPSSQKRSVFGDWKDSASEHSYLDTDRRNYVQDALEDAAAKGLGAEDIVAAGVRAGIEFTLNYFAAPVTADNVFSFSKRSGAFSEKDYRQLAERERLKRHYESLGGELRAPAKKKETAAESITRDWQLSLPSSGPDEGYPVAPPSPRRSPNLSESILEQYGIE